MRPADVAAVWRVPFTQEEVSEQRGVDKDLRKTTQGDRGEA